MKIDEPQSLIKQWECWALHEINIKTCTGGVNTLYLWPRLVQEVVKGQTFYELSWEVKAAIENKNEERNQAVPNVPSAFLAQELLRLQEEMIEAVFHGYKRRKAQFEYRLKRLREQASRGQHSTVIFFVNALSWYGFTSFHAPPSPRAYKLCGYHPK